MLPRFLPRLEALDSRLVLSTLAVPTPIGELLAFGSPGITTPIAHTIASQQASSVTLTLRMSGPDMRKVHHPIQVEVATGSIPTPSTADSSAPLEPPTTLWDLPGSQPFTRFPSAQAVVNYQPVTETITFPPGVTSEPVTIPIVAGAANPGMLSFEVTATQVGVKPQAYGSGQATEVVFLAQIINSNVPRVVGAHPVLSGRRVSDFLVQFSSPMDPASVQNINAYFVRDTTFHTHSGGLFGGLANLYPDGGSPSSSPVVLKTATYNPSTNIVDLHLATSVDARDAYQISRNSATGATLLTAAGVPINEDGTGLGGDFMITLTNKTTTIDGVSQSIIPITPPRR